MRLKCLNCFALLVALCQAGPEDYADFGTGACRGTSPTDNPSSWFKTVTGFDGTRSDCATKCDSTTGCVAFEYHVSWRKHCELWTKEPGATANDKGSVYKCVKKKASQPVYQQGYQPMPIDVQTILARFKVIAKKVSELQTKATGVGKLVAQVEALGKDTIKRVKISEKDLKDTSNRTSGNKLMIDGLRNQTKQAGLKVKAVLKDMKGLMQVVQKLEDKTTKKGSDAKRLAMENAELQNKVKTLLPGQASLTGRIDKVSATIATYEKEVGKGLGAIVEKSLRGHFKSATDSLDKLTSQTLKNNWEQTFLF